VIEAGGGVDIDMKYDSRIGQNLLATTEYTT
jgi:hypothetical protein